MFIHIVPRISVPSAYTGLVSLVSIEVPELRLKLHGGADLVARTPYRNKHYLVACRAVGSTGVHGFIVEVDQIPRSYKVVSTWLVDEHLRLVHTVIHQVQDADFDAVSDDPVMWMGRHGGKLKTRWPSEYAGMPPVHFQPRMDVCALDHGGYAPGPSAKDRIFDGKIVMDREETFFLPTIESARLFDENKSYVERIPVRNQVLRVKTASAP